jgi:PTH1 family peptidyl-tRNA hydrolase
MYLIVGLGNPGEKYKNSRHNVGFIILDEIFKSSWHAEKYGNAEILNNGEAVYVKPQTFMNNSGTSAKFFAGKLRIAPEHVVVIHDDVYLPFGMIKIVFDSGAGGHNGVKSIGEQLGTHKFLRIKVGIAPVDESGKARKPKGGLFTSEQKALADFVIKDFSKGDLEKIKSIAPKIKDCLDTIVHQGREKAMNKFN